MCVTSGQDGHNRAGLVATDIWGIARHGVVAKVLLGQYTWLLESLGRRGSLKHRQDIVVERCASCHVTLHASMG